MTRIDYRFTGCFLASMPDSFVSSRENTPIEAIGLFRVYTSSKIPAISEKGLNLKSIDTSSTKLNRTPVNQLIRELKLDN